MARGTCEKSCENHVLNCWIVHATFPTIYHRFGIKTPPSYTPLKSLLLVIKTHFPPTPIWDAKRWKRVVRVMCSESIQVCVKRNFEKGTTQISCQLSAAQRAQCSPHPDVLTSLQIFLTILASAGTAFTTYPSLLNSFLNIFPLHSKKMAIYVILDNHLLKSQNEIAWYNFIINSKINNWNCNLWVFILNFR